MGFLIKTVFFCALATLLVSFYGNDLVRLVSNEAKLARDAGPEQLRPDANMVHSLQIPVNRDGHYWLDMDVNNNDVHFVVDTGASYVTLSHQDAQKLDLRIFENDYDVVVNTAAGQTTMAEVNLDVVAVGVIELYDVKAFVAREGMLSVSLLGMNYLSRLDRFEFQDQKLILEQ